MIIKQFLILLFLFVGSAHAENVLGPFVFIPSLTYQIGSPLTDKDRNSNEKFEKVKLNPFYIMNAAVTQESYAQVMGVNPSKFKEKAYCPNSFKEILVKNQKIAVCADHPVEQVSYKDAETFAQAMNKLDSEYSYSLPTANQLEVAFRAGTTTAYVSGDTTISLGEYVWYEKNSNAQTHPVNSKKPNNFGVYTSSIFEWTSSYDSSSEKDILRLIRGCSWKSVDVNCRSAVRVHYPMDLPEDDIGFRLVRTKL